MMRKTARRLRDILQTRISSMRTGKTDGSSSRLPAFLRWPAFLIANIAILLLVGISTLRESYQGWTVDHEIHALEAQAQTLEGRKMQLVELADSLHSSDRVDLEARKQLGWKKPGEHVVVLNGYEATGTWQGIRASEYVTLGVPAPVPSNPERWWRYFFSHQ